MLLSFTGVMLAGLVAALITALLAPAAIRFTTRVGVVDRPDGKRKQQPIPIPLAGGPLLFFTFMVVTGIGTAFFTDGGSHKALWLSVTVPAAIVFVVGLYDDLFTSSPSRRLLFQTLAATLSSILTLEADVHIQLFSSSVLNKIIGVIWIVTLTNAFNFIDNMDGHSLTISAVAATGFTAVAGVNGQWLVAATAFVIACSAAALLKWNWQPAKIYLGDSGALFVGFLLATLALRIDLTDQQKWVSVFVPIILLTIPLIDIVIAVFGRFQRGTSPLVAGRDHLSHRLVKSGRSVKESVGILAAVAGLAAVLSVVISQASLILASVIIPTYFLLFVSAITWILLRTKPL